MLPPLHAMVPFFLASITLMSGYGTVSAFGLLGSSSRFFCGAHSVPAWVTTQHVALFSAVKSDDQELEDENDTEWLNAELVDDAEFYETDEEEEWMPDREKAKRKRQASRVYQQAAAATGADTETTTEKTSKESKGTVYTPEEEELINAMGGKFKDAPTKRQPGYLGDCTLEEIAMDYSVPICYIADVLCMWGVPVPINTRERLGDLVTGEQAFALLEAIYSLDISALHDRYSNMNLLAICDWYDIDIKDAFEMAVKEGWSLPFGVQTCLRVEQEDELVRVYGSIA